MYKLYSVNIFHLRNGKTELPSEGLKTYEESVKWARQLKKRLPKDLKILIVEENEGLKRVL